MNRDTIVKIKILSTIDTANTMYLGINVRTELGSLISTYNVLFLYWYDR